MGIKKYVNKNIVQYLIKYSINLLIDFLLLIFCLFRKKLNKEQFKIVTITDSIFFEDSLNLLNSIKFYEPDIEVAVIDIGLSSDQLDFLNSNYSYKVKSFDFASYPKFFNEYDMDGKLGSYAWKAPAIFNEYSKSKKNILYLDAGCRLSKRISLLKFLVLKNGFYSPESSNNIEFWTHPRTLMLMEVEKNLLKKRNFSSGIVGLAINNKQNEKVLKQWVNYSKNKEAIAPKGSSRKNHRQDQSLLNILVHQNLKSYLIPRTHKIFGILKHQNKDVGLFK